MEIGANQKITFNLVHEPWIPCVDLQGGIKNLGILSVLTEAHYLQGVYADTPIATAAILRILLALVYRNFVPHDENIWQYLWERGKFDADTLQAYFDQWHQRFDLFHPDKPFFQKRDLALNERPIDSLLMHKASGNSATLFDHSTELKGIFFTPAAAAQALITTQSFGLAGLCNPGMGLVYTDAPCARGMVLFMSGETLFETLMLNLVPYDFQGLRTKEEVDQPAWESDDPFIPHRIQPLGCLDFLTWQTRRIYLIPEVIDGVLGVRQVMASPGLNLGPDFLNPMYSYDQTQDTKKYLRFHETRGVWRDSAMLLDYQSPNRLAPWAIQWVAQLIVKGLLSKTVLKITAMGMDTDPGKQKVFSYRNETFSFSTKYFSNPALTDMLRAALEQAEETNRMLWAVLSKLGSLILLSAADVDEAPMQIGPKNIQALYQHWGSEFFFWDKIKDHFDQLLTMLAQDQTKAIQYWEEAVQKVAWQSFLYAVRMSGEGSQDLKAVIKAKDMFYNGLRQIFKSEILSTNEVKREIPRFVQVLFDPANLGSAKNLAILRSGIYQWPDQISRIHSLITPHIPEADHDPWCEAVYYLIGTLFAYYPENSDRGNMGSHFRLAGPYGSVQEQHIENQFSLLLSSDTQELSMRLQKVVDLLRSKVIKVNWAELFMDLLQWNAPGQPVQKKWANDFWGYHPVSQISE
jgi:CRISPR system Cascade subunit CasA